MQIIGFNEGIFSSKINKPALESEPSPHQQEQGEQIVLER